MSSSTGASAADRGNGHHEYNRRHVSCNHGEQTLSLRTGEKMEVVGGRSEYCLPRGWSSLVSMRGEGVEKEVVAPQGSQRGEALGGSLRRQSHS